MNTTTTQKTELGAAGFEWDGECLTARHENFTRRWRLTATGLATALLETGGPVRLEREPGDDERDWKVYRLADGRQEARLEGVWLTAEENPRWMAPHVRALFEFRYAETELLLRYAVEVFADAPGVRTQLFLRAERPFTTDELPSYPLQSHGESLRLDVPPLRRQAAGYYNDAQHRNHDDLPILRRWEREGALVEGRREVYDRANLLALGSGGSGLALVKESHKCVNQSGIDGGAFILDGDGVRVTGLGLKDNNYTRKRMWLPHECFRSAWATWCLPFEGGEPGKQMAVKRFDRARFRPAHKTPLFSRANTWGSRMPGAPARGAAEQANVLREIESCADLGIDALAIDDGWQVPPEGGAPSDAPEWTPDPRRFPNGWSAVREAAERAGVELHLWFPGARLSIDQILHNLESGGFTGCKADFLGFQTRDILDDVLDKIRRAAEHTEPPLHVSWDVTEEAPRLGWYCGREFGSLHYANRKGSYAETDRVHHIAYTPRLILRDAWHLAHYLNLSDIEIPVQDAATLDPSVNDAATHPQDYCTAIGLAGLPLYFMETHTFAGAPRDAVRQLMGIWREQRAALGEAFVFPLGAEPCGGAWTGFQWASPEGKGGYALVFREPGAAETEAALELPVPVAGPTQWRDLRDGESWISEDPRTLRCRIDEAPGFRFLEYRCDAGEKG